MPTRTFKLHGYVADGDAGANITVTFNGTQVHNGSVNNTDKEEPLLTFTADTSVSGDIATTVVVNSGSITFIGPLSANYVVFDGQSYTDDDSVEHSYTTADVTDIYSPMNSGLGSAMKSVQIDGEESSVTGSESTGWVPVPVESGSTLTCNMVVDAMAKAAP